MRHHQGVPATIAISVTLDTRYGGDLLRGVCRAARGWGWRFRQVRAPALRGPPFPWPVDGVIGYLTPAQVARVAALGVPVVNLTPAVADLGIDEEAVGACAARHLIARGLPRLAVAMGWYMDAGCARRLEGFRRVAAAAGVPCIDLPRPRLTPAPLLRALARWWRTAALPVGVFAANDHFALVAMQAALDAGLAVPGQVALVGADNDEACCELAPVPLASVALPHEPLGAAAALRLRALLAGGKPGPGRTFAPGVVVERASSDLPQSDPQLARALACIRERHAEALGVAAVAQAAGLHRRALERRFRAAFGRSVHDELARQRIQRAQELLVDGRLTVTEVAAAVGLSPSAFAEAFTTAVGTSPGAWREARGG
jgi:LacI family transcriptional regulator